MKLSEIKETLRGVNTVKFELPNGDFVPSHFHVTEVGQINKRYIDCGGQLRTESKIAFQLWYSTDVDHSLSADKLNNIIALSEQKLGLDDAEIEVEFQSDTIGKYDLSFNGSHFVLLNTHTDCLAKDSCGIPAEKPRVRISAQQESACCPPNSGCC